MPLRNEQHDALTGRRRAVRECALWLLRRRTRHRVVNASMEPTATAGDYLLVNPGAYRETAPSPGDVVVAQHPLDERLTIIKRVRRVVDRRVELISDNLNQGQDSREFGPLPLERIRGQVTCIIR